MKLYKVFVLITATVVIFLASCTKDLDTSPIDPKVQTADEVFKNDSSYIEFLSKCYGGLVATGLGTNGGWGDPELANGDEGVTSFLRLYWGAQEMTTDEAINVWGDGDLNEYHIQKWSDANSYNFMLYKRIFYNITVCNEFIRDVTPRISSLSGTLKQNVTQYLAEVRFLRALFYYYAMDLWGNVPFVTEKDPIGNFMPKQINRADLFKYIESELKTISPALMAPNTDSKYYGRANRAADWMLLAKMYLNSEVYLGGGNKKYADCITYCDSITNSNIYSLHTTSAGKYSAYQELFLGDNNLCKEEIIFPINCDKNYTQNYGGTTFIIHAEIGGNMSSDIMGTGGWGGNICTYAFMQKFADPTGLTDKRALFYSQGSGASTASATTGFNVSLAVSKWLNMDKNGNKVSTSDFMSNDFPLFRLSDVYLMYAEAVIRNTGSANTAALNYINQILARAYGNTSGNITLNQLTLPFILDERGRELYWEAQRRTDLIRFSQFSTGTYVWDWKGGVNTGVATDSYLNLFPIPSGDRAVNANLVQNPGY
jgi:hypothetical protein